MTAASCTWTIQSIANKKKAVVDSTSFADLFFSLKKLMSTY
jgi:hypothetical protein